ncbi:DUF4145 domain-containing protein [Brevibacillus porteri]|uniref:DUF4145 domain-containing protein n=1 Tax=Brevibacillus porteri TaxID=2126350 RepID=UPI00362F547F
MKTTMFEVEKSALNCSKNTDVNTNSEYPYIWKISNSLFLAYSIEYFSLQHGGQNVQISADQSVGHELIILSEYELIDDVPTSVVLHYHGVRDYSLLFPWVANVNLRERLGLFYEEAEKNFDQGAWLSFALMCGAVFEGMLFAKLNPASSRNNFSNMITDATANRLLNGHQQNIMNTVRNFRNLVHGNLYTNPYITRKDAMDIRTTLDKLIKEFN